MSRITAVATLLLAFVVYHVVPVRAQDKRDDPRIEALEKQVAQLRATVASLEQTVSKEEVVRREVEPRTALPSRRGAAAPGVESQLETLQQALQVLADRVDQMEDDVEAASDLVGFTQQGNALVLDHPGDVRIKAGSGLELEAGGGAKLRAQGSIETRAGTGAKLEAGANLDLIGALVKLNGGAKPLARMGDAVSVSPTSGQGSVTGGTTAVLVP